VIFGNPPNPASQKLYETSRTFTPATDGTCIVSVSGCMTIGEPGYTAPLTRFTPAMDDKTAGVNVEDNEAAFKMNGDITSTGSSTTGFEVTANHTYLIGVKIQGNDDPVVTDSVFMSLTATWICQ